MNSFSQLILVLGIFGLAFIGASPILGLAVALVGGVLCIVPSVIIYLAAKRSGALLLMMPQRRGETLVFYISGTRRIFPLLGRELLERYIKIVRGHGRIRITKGSDYLMMGKKVVFARAGSAHTIPIEQAEFATKLKNAGYRNLEEAEEAYKKGELKL